jgi:predicted permease
MRAVLESLVRDLRLGTRMLRKQPGVTAIAVATLALGLGLTTLMFSIIDGIVLQGLPFPESRRLMAILRVDPARGEGDLRSSLLDVTDWQTRQHAFEEITAYWNGPILLTGGHGAPELIAGVQSTPNLFHLLRQAPALGRTFRPEDGDPASPPVIIISDGIWRRRYGGDPHIVGKTVRVNAHETTVIGVMPRGFLFPGEEQVWRALQRDPSLVQRGNDEFLAVIGRLRPKVTVRDAAAEFAGIARHLAEEYPATSGTTTLRLKPLDQVLRPTFDTDVVTMAAAVFGVLLIACFNVANLLLARASTRMHDVAIRMALGADRRRVVSQMLIETLLLATLGAALGLGVAQLGITVFNRGVLGQAPSWVNIRINVAVAAFVAFITALSAVIAGIGPALQASRTDVNLTLKDQARGSSSLHLGQLSRALVILELTLSCSLLVGTGLVVKSVIKLATFDYGFATDVFTGRIPLGVADVSTGEFVTSYPDSSSRQRFWAEVLRRVRAEPGVLSASLMNVLPGTGAVLNPVAVEGRAYATEHDYPPARWAVITPDFFRTFDVSILQGRDFQPTDDWGAAPVAIVNQSFAAHFGPAHGSALGMRIRFSERSPWRTVVGVVPDMYMTGNDEGTPWGYYLPLGQWDRRFMSIGVRARGDPMALTNQIQRDVAAVDPDLPAYNIHTVRQVIDAKNLQIRVFGTLFMAFGVVALCLASIGLYGVMAFAVSRRTQEIGVRMALGATGPDVVRMFLRQGLKQLGAGMAIGLVLALWLANALRFALFRVQTRDPVVVLAVVALLAVVGMLACFIPARRASRVDPLVALRHE